jgi:citrate synthase
MAEISYSRGLAGVIADESKICTIDGEKGELYYYGYPIQTLAKESNYSEITFLLLYGHLPNSSELEGLERKLRAAREVPGALLDLIRGFPRDAHPMRGLQASTACLGMFDSVPGDASQDDQRELAIRLIGAYPTLIACIANHREGRDFVQPRSDLSHAANFLYMLQGKEPEEHVAKMFDVCLVLHAEHTFNASTFTGRVVGSTLADLHSAVAAAVGALSGSLHGGANERVLKMLENIGGLDNVNSWFENAMATKKKVMGMGHRVYKTIDPRAKILRAMLDGVAQATGEKKDLEVLGELADLMAKQMDETGKQIWPNVDYYSGSLYRLLGIDTIDFTPIFALSRVSGWTAHVLELWSDNRLYRPKCHYVGEKDLPYVPISQR